MLKTAQLRKLARDILLPKLEAHGFSMGRSGARFWRKINDIYHFISLGILRSGSLDVSVDAWVPEGQPSFRGRLPEEYGGSDPGRGMYAYQFVGSEGLDPIWVFWRVENEEAAPEVVRRMLRALQEYGVPWLDQIVTRERLVEALHPQFRNDQDRVDLILRKFKTGQVRLG